VLIEVLRVAEYLRAGRALASDIGSIARKLLTSVSVAATTPIIVSLLSAIWWSLHTVYSSQVALKNIGAVEQLYSRRTRT
jgi:hypothetical protein